MKTLLRIGLRELRASRSRAALLASILTVQTTALGAGSLTEESLSSTRRATYERLHLADLEVQIAPAGEAELPSLESLRAVRGVRDASARFVAVGSMDTVDGAPLPVAVHYLDPGRHPAVNDIEVQSGAFLAPGRPDLALVDRSFAESHRLRLGDTLVVDPHRFATTFHVGGTALSPEYLVPTANPAMLVPHRGSLGIVYASREALDRVFPDRLVNDLLFTFDAGVDPEEATRAVLGALSGVDVERVVPRRANFGHRYVDEILRGSRSVLPVVALLLATMAAVVAFLSVQRLVAERRRDIGTLLAHGYSARELVLAVLPFGLVPGIAGALAGVPGAFAFAAALARLNSRVAGFPEPVLAWSWRSLGFAGLASVVVGVLAALVPAFGIFRARPTHALRGAGEVRFTGAPRAFLRLLPRVTAVRYAIENVFRRPHLSLATVGLVALAVAMPAGLLTTIASWDTWARAQATVLPWDAIVAFKVPLREDQVRELLASTGVHDYEVYAQGHARVERAGAGPEEMRVRGLAVPGVLSRYELVAGSGFSRPDADEAILNRGFSAGTRPPQVGETVTVTARGGSRSLRIVGLVENASLSTIVVPIGTAQALLGKGEVYAGAYVAFSGPRSSKLDVRAELPPPAPRPEIAERIDLDDGSELAPRGGGASDPTAHRTGGDVRAALLTSELVTSVELKAEFAAATLRYLEAFNAGVVPFVGLGSVLAFAFVLSMLGFLLLEREVEYVTLRAMGYGPLDVAQSVLVEVALLASLGIALSVPAWTAMAYALRAPMAEAWLSVPLDFRAHDFATVAAPTLLAALLAAVPGVRGIMRLDLTAVLRARAGS